jgi:mono/diheme cytochrome c family protein
LLKGGFLLPRHPLSNQNIKLKRGKGLKKKLLAVITALVLVLSTVSGVALASERQETDSAKPAYQRNGNDRDEGRPVAADRQEGDRDEDEEEEEDENEERATELTGAVQSVTPTSITVQGKNILINGSTDIEGKLAVGVIVEVEVVSSGNSIIAKEIEVKRSTTPPPNTLPPSPPTTPPPPVIPSSPSNLTGTTISSSQVNLGWTDNANNETGFRIQRAGNSAFTTGLNSWTVGANVIALSDVTATANTAYYYRVFATNGGADSAASNVITVTTPAPPPPAVIVPTAPTGLAATAASSTQVNLTWADNSSNETGFRIERAANSGFTGTLSTFTVGAGIVAYSDTSAVASTTYYYRVFATNSAGSSTASNTASVTTPAPPVVIPTAPSGLAATAASSTQVNLTWTDNSNNETGFKVQRATDSGFTTGLTTLTVGANLTSYSNTGLTASTTYYYRVLATNTAGDSTASNTATIMTQAPALNGQTIFNSSCTSCHGLSTATGTSRTQAQLISWIPGHNTGSSLTSAQVAAVAAYIKP